MFYLSNFILRLNLCRQRDRFSDSDDHFVLLKELKNTYFFGDYNFIF